MKEFKEDYRVTDTGTVDVLPDVFRVLEKQYNCDTIAFIRWMLPHYREVVEQAKEKLEQELTMLVRVRELLLKVT